MSEEVRLHEIAEAVGFAKEAYCKDSNPMRLDEQAFGYAAAIHKNFSDMPEFWMLVGRYITQAKDSQRKG
jgi:hypothetical protein